MNTQFRNSDAICNTMLSVQQRMDELRAIQAEDDCFLTESQSREYAFLSAIYNQFYDTFGRHPVDYYHNWA